MSVRKSKVVKVNISAGTYKDEAEAVREANAIKRWLIRHCEKNGYSIKGKVWISTNSAYAGRIINKGRKKEYKPNGKPLPTVVEAHIHMVLFCNPASTIVDALKSYLNKKHMKAVVWDRHCNSRAEVENAVEYAMRQSRKVRTIDYDRKDVLSVDEWGYYEAVERAEARIKNNMAFTKSEPEQTPETLENKSVSSISDTPETLTYKSIKHNYLYYYIVPTSYNHSIVKALLQEIIYYGRDSSRRCCSKIIFKKVLLKVPHLLKNVKFCVIIIMYDERTDEVIQIMRYFSDRYNLAPEKEIQLNDIDLALFNRLWNVLYSREYEWESWLMGGGEIETVEKLLDSFGCRYTFPSSYCDRNSNIEKLREFLMDAEWYVVYDFIERYVESFENSTDKKNIEKEVNTILEEEKAGYRMVKGMIVPITNEEELNSLKKVMTSPFTPVSTHFEKALRNYSNRKSPDYENSIKESISAVEAICSIITGETGSQATLGKTLKKLKDKGVHIHSAMESAFSSLYGYTSDENGIRHGGIDFKNAPAEDAKYMLISCSAFVNYLIEKWQKVQNP